MEERGIRDKESEGGGKHQECRWKKCGPTALTIK